MYNILIYLTMYLFLKNLMPINKINSKLYHNFKSDTY